MKVIQVMPEFGLAGAEIMAENLSKELKKAGVEVIVVSLFHYNSPITKRLEEDGIRVVYLDKKSGFDVSIYKKLIKLFKIEKPDVVHTHRYVMQYAIPAAVLTHVPVRMHTVHSVASKEQEKGKRVLACFFYHLFHVHPVALSPEIKKTIIKEYHLMKENVEIVYNGEDLSRFQPKVDYSINKIFRIIHIGRFMKVKNHKAIINASILLKAQGIPVEFEFIGDDSSDLANIIKEQVRKYSLDDIVAFCGTKADVAPYLHNADAFVLPSFYEGVPMTLIEAMACGLPIVAANVGGVCDMLKDGVSALLIQPNSEELANAIEQLYNRADLREKLGKGAQEKSKLFTAHTMSEGYIKIYNKYLGKN